MWPHDVAIIRLMILRPEYWELRSQFFLKVLAKKQLDFPEKKYLWEPGIFSMHKLLQSSLPNVPDQILKYNLEMPLLA